MTSLSQVTYASASMQARLALADIYPWELLAIIGRLAERETVKYSAVEGLRVREKARLLLQQRHRLEYARLREEYLAAVRASVDWKDGRAGRKVVHDYPQPCPLCGAPSGVHCHTRSGAFANMHAARKRIPSPTRS